MSYYGGLGGVLNRSRFKVVSENPNEYPGLRTFGIQRKKHSKRATPKFSVGSWSNVEVAEELKCVRRIGVSL